ncbi:hypothetical protein BDV96DRAFT_652287 [Lophiotrema nucula]|uniref:CFEM domain-containing protein n=1 Tax=Lophiotrema nucula TaxID=690887 RepID=A0A6A5YP82_9PLEO|nr:hypothetical protein BDV96DRAFT_652287 [Lophiotrema nucula]
MRFTSIAFAASLGSIALSQSLTDSLPKCAQACFGTNFGSCTPLDIHCICASTDLIHNISCCVIANCDDADRQTTTKFAYDLCVANQVTVDTQPVCSSTSAPASSGSATSPASGSATSTASVTAATVLSGSATPTAAGSTGAAALHTAGVGMGMGLAVAGFVAAL